MDDTQLNLGIGVEGLNRLGKAAESINTGNQDILKGTSKNRFA
jgi:hypothetical protein